MDLKLIKMRIYLRFSLFSIDQIAIIENVLRRVPGYGPDRRGTWALYFNLLLSILVTNAHHSIYHAQGEVLSIICPPLIIQIILS